MKIKWSILLLIWILCYNLNAEKKKAFEDFIPPVSNPIYFESPFHTTEIRAIHIYQKLHGKIKTDLGHLPLDGTLNVTAVQLRYRVNDRLSIIATKDGYARLKYNNTLGNEDGFADLAIGIKYTFISDVENQFVLTSGIRVELPTGDKNVLQNAGDGLINPFITFAKGFDKTHILGAFGLRLPFNSNKQDTIADFSLHLDHKIGNFYPLIELNFSHILSSGNGGRIDADVDGTGPVNLNVINSHLSGQDIANFGGSRTEGNSYLNWTLGFRYKLNDRITLGAAWTSPLGDNSESLFDSRFTFDCIIEF